jgi:HAD superfamily hydrolase (TIGR01459 family)
VSEKINNLRALFDRCDAFVFDIWGVLHNGTTCYPGVLETLRNLKAAGKKIGILSNSPRPLPSAADNIVKYGLLPELYDAILTSGHLTYEALQQRGDAWLKKLGTKALVLGSAHEGALYDTAGITRVAEPETADFILTTSLWPATATAVHDAMPLLRRCLANKLPMICANPDREVAIGDQKALASGALADAYQAMGGDVRIIDGKPHPAIYARLLHQLGVTPDRAVMIGDNLTTDIAGAQVVGMTSILMLGGMYGPELGAGWGVWPDDQALKALVTKHKITPDYGMTQLSV